MKKFYAWLLLSISTFQWVGGHICFEVSYFIEVEHRMDEAEKAIAEEVKDETGVETNVKILHGDEIIPRGHIYSDFFAFSKDMDDGTVFFTIQDDTSTVTYEQVTKHQQPKQEDEGKAALLKSLYQDFTLPESMLSVAAESDLPIANFQLTALHHSFHTCILTPPPDLS